MAEHSTPHILVQADWELTEHLWDKSAVKPFVLAPANHRSRLKNERTRDGDPYVYRFPALNLIGHLLLERPNHASYDELCGVLETARRHFAPEDGRLRISVVGSHTSISAAIVAGYKQEPYLDQQELMPGMRRHRQLAGLLGAALRMLPDVDTPWLAPAYPELLPTAMPPKQELVDLAARGRSDLDVLTFEQGVVDTRLSRPALPMMYVREVKDGETSPWEQLGPVDARPPYWTTDNLIGQFRQACATRPHLEGVLVKVVGERTELYCPVDPPVVGDKTFDTAAGLNIRAILLDARFGIIRPFKLPSPLLPPVFGI